MKIPMKARRAFKYAGRNLTAGQPFEARGRQDAKLLEAIGHAEIARVPVVEAAPARVNVEPRLAPRVVPAVEQPAIKRDAQSAPEQTGETPSDGRSNESGTDAATEAEAAPEPTRRRRTYRRRDMTAGSDE